MPPLMMPSDYMTRHAAMMPDEFAAMPSAI